MQVLMPVEAFLPALLLLFSGFVLYGEKIGFLKSAIYLVVSGVLSLTAISLLECDGHLKNVILFAICIALAVVFEHKNIAKKVTGACFVLLCTLSGQCFFAQVTQKYVLLLSFIYCAIMLTAAFFVPAENDKVRLYAKNGLLLIIVVAGILSGLLSDISVGIILSASAFLVRLGVLPLSGDDDKENVYDKARMLRHDLKNMMFGIKGSLKENNYDEFEKLLEEFEKTTNDVNFKQQAAIVSQLEDPAVKWLFADKLMEAQKRGINTSLVVSKKINFGRMKRSEFTSVLGNLIDNAVEAAEESENKLLKIAVFNKNGDTIISVKNTYGKKPVISKIFDKGYSEKKGHSGLGLYSVRKTVNSYPEILLDIRIQNNYFTVDMNISGSCAQEEE